MLCPGGERLPSKNVMTTSDLIILQNNVSASLTHPSMVLRPPVEYLEHFMGIHLNGSLSVSTDLSPDSLVLSVGKLCMREKACFFYPRGSEVGLEFTAGHTPLA